MVADGKQRPSTLGMQTAVDFPPMLMGDSIQINNVIGIINSNLKTIKDHVLDVDSKCLEEPMPYTFDWHIMNTTCSVGGNFFLSSSGVYAALRIHFR